MQCMRKQRRKMFVTFVIKGRKNNQFQSFIENISYRLSSRMIANLILILSSCTLGKKSKKILGNNSKTTNEFLEK